MNNKRIKVWISKGTQGSGLQYYFISVGKKPELLKMKVKDEKVHNVLIKALHGYNHVSKDYTMWDFSSTRGVQIICALEMERIAPEIATLKLNTCRRAEISVKFCK